MKKPPGEILQTELRKRGLSQEQAADRIGVHRVSLNRVLRGHAGITAEMALKLEELTETPAIKWLYLQAEHDLAKAREAGCPGAPMGL